jgi:hypothetical protein
MRTSGESLHALVRSVICFSFFLISAMSHGIETPKAEDKSVAQHAGHFVFTKVVGSTTPVPNATGTFTNLGTPRIIQSNIFFVGSGGGRQGLYKWSNSSLTRLVDTSMSPPSGVGTFSSIGEFNINDAGDVIFSANCTSGTNGIYRIRGGVITYMVGNITSVPGKDQTFRSVRSGFESGDLFSFDGYSIYPTNSLGTGLYLMTNGTVSLLIDRDNGTLPGTASTFRHSDGGVMDNGQLAFWAMRSDGKAGIYCYSSNVIHLIADTNTVPPGQSVTFTGFTDPPRINDGKVVFHGSFSGGAGLYSANADGSELTKLVDTQTLIPDSTNTFQSGLFIAFSGLINGRMLFYNGYWDEAAFKNKPRMYLYDNGTITMVVDGETLLDGEKPTNLGWGAQSIQASGEIAFMAAFGAAAPYTPAIYTTLHVGSTTRYTLTRLVNPLSTGTITANPASEDGKYNPGAIVQLTAAPAAGKIFAGWSGAVSGMANPVSVTMSSNKTVTATFTNAPGTNAVRFQLTRSVSPAASGIITVNPSSTNGYASNSVVTLTATANSGFRFLRWAGASTSTNRTLNLVMNANKTVQALFTNLPKYKLTTAVNPPTAGSITLSPFAPTNTYNAGTIVTLVATPNGTNQFAAWIGATTGVTNRATLTMDAPKSVTALFNNRGSLVFQNPAGQVAVWFMQNTQRLTSVMLNNGLSAGSNWRLAGAADFDRNGSQDLLYRGTNGQTMVWRMTGNTPTNTFVLRSGATLNPSWRIAAAEDLNRDAKADILWQNTNGVFSVWLMNGLVYSTNANLAYPANGYRALAADNFDTNGSPDIVLQNATGQVQVWLMNGLTRMSIRPLNNGVSPGSAWVVAGATDIDGDRKPDLLFRRSDGAILVWFMNGTTITKSVVLPNNSSPPWVLQALK